MAVDRHAPAPKTTYVNQSMLVEPLTAREMDVLGLLAQRRSAKEIAQELVITVPTVKRHVANIYLKLGVSNRGEAVAAAAALGLVPPAPG